MAKLVLGIGSSHAPQLGIPAAKWQLLREKDENDHRMNFAAMAKNPRPGIEKELTSEKWQKRYDACMKALAVLRETLERIAPDVVVILGDDQHEHLLDDNMPVFCIYRGASVAAVERKDRMKVAWKAAEIEGRNIRLKSFTCAPELAEHLIQHLGAEGFDIACSNQLRPEVGLGHAFTAMYSQLMPDGRFPIVPFMVNTFYPPNQPHPRRCYTLGQALRKSIEAWDGNQRVALIASGGLSHVIIDEEVDQITIDGLVKKDREKLCSLPVARLTYGTSEIRNWVVLAGAVEDFNVKLIDYVPCYRSMAGTGCAMAFAHWT